MGRFMAGNNIKIPPPFDYPLYTSLLGGNLGVDKLV